MKLEKMRILAHLPSLSDARPKHLWAGVAVMSVLTFSMVAAFGTAPTSAEIQAFQETVVEPLSMPPAENRDLSDSGGATYVREERIQRGDSAAALLARLGVQDEQAFVFLKQQPQTQSIFRQLRPGKVVTAKTNRSGELQSLVFPLNGNTDSALVVDRRDGHLWAGEQVLSLTSQITMKSGEIRNSLFGATDAIDLPDSIALQLAEIFGSDIDFHRDLRRGDRFSVVYEMLYNQGQAVRAGRILAAEFVNQDKAYRAVWFESQNGQGYYTPDGKSLRKAFLRSPLEFSRVSSGFTLARFHPILKTWRAHKGVDYAAPIGTRVKATGDGVVETIGKQGGYGNLVILRHQGKFSTAYGHLSGFASGLRKGARVSQGDVIGYVGQTGWATGPHLHYEFRVSDVQQNPLAVNLPGAPPLPPQQMAQFKQHADPLSARLDQVRGINLALLD